MQGPNYICEKCGGTRTFTADKYTDRLKVFCLDCRATFYVTTDQEIEQARSSSEWLNDFFKDTEEHLSQCLLIKSREH